MDRDRNLLFGVFAVQLRKTTPSAILEAAAAWATDQSKDLPHRLQEQGLISAKDRDLLNGLVEEAIRTYAGDVTATIAAVSGDSMFQQSLYGAIDGDTSAGLELSLGDFVSSDTIDSDSLIGIQEVEGRYTHPREHASGGMGRVLLVRDRYLNRDVALKELLSDLHDEIAPERRTPGSTAIETRFLQEARITGKLEHPSIVPVYELGYRRNGTLYYTMKFVRGDSFSHAIQMCESLEQRLRLLPHFLDLCNAIAYAHSKGVIHRDIKPSNVMVGAFGETVVIDWGLAKSRGNRDVYVDDMASTIAAKAPPEDALSSAPPTHGKTSSLTASGQRLGTPAYMPPEQAEGRIEDVDERSDIYALGAVLYEVVAGKKPYAGRSATEILAQVVQGPPEPLDSVVPSAPLELVAICERAMSRKPDDRFPTAKAIAEEIQRFRLGEVVESYSYRRSELALKAVRSVFRTRRGDGEIRKANRELREANKRLQALNEQLVETNQNLRSARDREAAQRVLHYESALVVARDQLNRRKTQAARNALMNAPVAPRNFEWGYLYGLLDRSQHSLTGHLREVVDVAYFINGSLLSISADGTAIIWCASMENSRTFSPLGQAQLTACATGGTTSRWAVASAEGKVAVLNETGEMVHEADVDCGRMNSLTFMDEDQRLLGASEDGVIRGWRLDEQSECFTQPAAGVPCHLLASPDGLTIYSACQDGVIRSYDSSFDAPPREFRGHSDWVSRIALTDDGRTLVSASLDRTLRVWDTESGICSKVLAGHAERIYGLALTRDNAEILSASFDNTIRRWCIETGAERDVYLGHASGVRAVSASPDGTHFASASQDQLVKIWTLSEATTPVLSGGREESSALQFDPQGNLLYVALPQRDAIALTIESGHEQVRFRSNDQQVTALAIAESATRIAGALAGGGVIVWNSENGSEVSHIECSSETLRGISLSPMGDRLATLDATHRVLLWDLDSGEIALELPSCDESAESVSFTRGGSRLVAAGHSAARVWDAVPWHESAWLDEQNRRQISAVCRCLPPERINQELDAQSCMAELLEDMKAMLEDEGLRLTSERRLKDGDGLGVYIAVAEPLDRFAAFEFSNDDLLVRVNEYGVRSLSDWIQALDALMNRPDIESCLVEFEILGYLSRRIVSLGHTPQASPEITT